MFNLLPKLLQILLPYTCVFCNKSAHQYDLCQACYQQLPWLATGCTICAHPLPHTENLICGACIQQPKFFDYSIALFRYAPPIDRAIVGLKFHHQLKYSQLLSELLWQKLSQYYQLTDWPQAIIPVPLHVNRLRHRGFNQAVELARLIARRLKIPILTQPITRLRATSAQLELSADKRYQNVQQAFSITAPLPYPHVAIVDDVMTTTHTANELSKALRAAGAKKIAIWCCARTLPTYL